MTSRPDPAPGIVTRRLIIFTGPIGVCATNDWSCGFSPTAPQLLPDVSARALGPRGTRRPRPDRDDLPQILVGAAAVESGLARLCRWHADRRDEQEECRR